MAAKIVTDVSFLMGVAQLVLMFSLCMYFFLCPNCATQRVYDSDKSYQRTYMMGTRGKEKEDNTCPSPKNTKNYFTLRS